MLTNGGVDPAKRISGFDLTFSAPKSVSLLYGLSEREESARVRAAHAEAVSQAIGYLERRALEVRRGAGGLEHLDARGMVAAAFLHRTSRAGDPQLHTHVLVANVAEGHDGIWSAPDARLLYAHARTAGYLYQATLRARLGQTLGVRFGPVERGVGEIDGMPKHVLRAFSTRRREIEEVLGAGEHSRRAGEAAALATRTPKQESDAGLSGPGLRYRWHDRAGELGLDTQGSSGGVFDQLVGVVEWSPPTPEEADELVARLVGPLGLTAERSTFEPRDVVRAVAEGLPRGSLPREVEAIADRVLADPEVLDLSTVGMEIESRHTTHELLELERSLLDVAGRRGGGRTGVAEEAPVAEALRQFPLLSDEQIAMVRRLATSGTSVDVVVGKAGAGKTLALAAARQAWDASGHRVLGTALSARAARGLSEGAGIDSETLSRVLARLSSGSLELGPTDVVVLDEAGMVGTRQLSALLDATTTSDAKLVLVGDHRQLPEIEAGGALGALVRRHGAIELSENRRQQEPWERFALDALRLGRAEVAVASYEQAGRVHVAPTMAEALTRLVESWVESFAGGHDAVMLAVGRAEAAELNAMARVVLRGSDRLGSDVLEVDGTGYAIGDRVVCLRNDRRIAVVNGMVGTVERRVGAGLAIATEDGARVVPASYLEAGLLGHGYALTVYKAQGLTVEWAFVLSSATLTREAGYVAMSRARESTELFAPLRSDTDEVTHDPRAPWGPDPLDQLRRQLGTSRAKHLAFEERDRNAPLGEDGAGVDHSQSTMPRGDVDVTAVAGVCRPGRAGRGLDDAAMGFQQLDTHPDSSETESESSRVVRERQRRRLADALSRRTPEHVIEPQERSLGLGR
jgi:conjugative relaxase-like TrwC/TraI family protein